MAKKAVSYLNKIKPPYLLCVHLRMFVKVVSESPCAISQLVSGVSKSRFTVNTVIFRLRDGLLVPSSKPEHILVERA